MLLLLCCQKHLFVKKSSDFQHVIRQGKRLRISHFLLFYLTHSIHDEHQFGIAVGKKYFSAVQRNKIKRQIRMMLYDFGRQKPVNQQKFTVIIMVQKSFFNTEFAIHKKKLLYALNVLQ